MERQIDWRFEAPWPLLPQQLPANTVRCHLSGQYISPVFLAIGPNRALVQISHTLAKQAYQIRVQDAPAVLWLLREEAESDAYPWAHGPRGTVRTPIFDDLRHAPP